LPIKRVPLFGAEVEDETRTNVEVKASFGTEARTVTKCEARDVTPREDFDERQALGLGCIVMTDYSQLKKKREAKQKSFNGIKTYQDQADFRPELKGDDSERTQPQLGPLPHNTNGLYASLPRSQEIRVNNGESGNGRGIYSLFHRKPGEYRLHRHMSIYACLSYL